MPPPPVVLRILDFFSNLYSVDVPCSPLSEGEHRTFISTYRNKEADMPRIARTENTFSYIDNQRAQELLELREYSRDLDDDDIEEAIAAELFANRTVFPGAGY